MEVEENEVEEKPVKSKEKSKSNSKTLFFKEPFWSIELNRSFKAGHYTPKTEAEFKAIEKFGVEQDKKKMEVR